MPSKPESPKSVAISARSIEEGAKSGKLAPEEERLLRMRHGLGLAADEPLGRIGQDDPRTRAQLAVLEVEAFRAMGRLGGPAAQPSREKEKIVRALRKKG